VTSSENDRFINSSRDFWQFIAVRPWSGSFWQGCQLTDLRSGAGFALLDWSLIGIIWDVRGDHQRTERLAAWA
jgi:hypothetical protein